jgi:hypothetical protein
LRCPDNKRFYADCRVQTYTNLRVKETAQNRYFSKLLQPDTYPDGIRSHKPFSANQLSAAGDDTTRPNRHPEFLTSSPGAKFDPQGESWPPEGEVFP